MLTVQARAGTSDMLEEAARWAKRNAKALKLARYALRHGIQPSGLTLPKSKFSLLCWGPAEALIQYPLVIELPHLG